MGPKTDQIPGTKADQILCIKNGPNSGHQKRTQFWAPKTDQIGHLKWTKKLKKNGLKNWAKK